MSDRIDAPQRIVEAMRRAQEAMERIQLEAQAIQLEAQAIQFGAMAALDVPDGWQWDGSGWKAPDKTDSDVT